MKTIELKKGKVVSLDKGLTEFEVVVSWRNLRSNLDVDLLCLELGNDGKLVDLAYYNSDRDPETGLLSTDDRAIQYYGDDRGTGLEAGEKMEVNLGKLSPKVGELLFVANIYEAGSTYTFANLADIEVQIKKKGNDVPDLVYRLVDDFSDCRYLQIASIRRESGSWYVIKPIGIGNSDDLATNLSVYSNNISGNA